MSSSNSHIKLQLSRQVIHWAQAVERFHDLNDLASPAAWSSLEQYLSVLVRQHLKYVVNQLNKEAAQLYTTCLAANTDAELVSLHRQLRAFRDLYMRVETTLDFFADAINTRTSPKIAGYLRACDTLAHRCMAKLLDSLGKPVPVVLTYVDKGLGASILKAGLRLWDGTGINPVAAIKITRHNLLRPTALIHEAGHQVAHIVGWNKELTTAIRVNLDKNYRQASEIWASWASEIAADAYAFAHTGYGSIAALHDVLAGNDSMVFRYIPGEPHPVSYIRVLLGVEMCQQFYGDGPWNDLAKAWGQLYPLGRASSSGPMLQALLPLVPRIVEISLKMPMRAFGGKPLSAIVNPERVNPESLIEMEQQLGEALYNSSHWIWTEALRLLALSSLKAATSPENKASAMKQQENWMLKLGGALQTA